MTAAAPEPDDSRATDWPKLFTIGFMYMAQTFPAGFVMSLIPTLFRKNGLPLEHFWVFSLPTIPYWIRWAWGPVVDTWWWRPLGRRRSWFVPCTVAAMLAYMSLALFEPTEQFLVAITLVLILKSMFTSVQEVAIDAYVVDYTTVKERPKAAGINTAFEAIGQMAALSGLAIVFDTYGWRPTVILASFLMLLFLLPAFFRKERLPADAERAALERRGAGVGALVLPFRRFIARPDTRIILPVVISGGLFTGALFPMIGPFLIDAGFNVTRVGVVTGTVLLTATVTGAATAAYLCDRLGPRRVNKVLAFTTPLFFAPITIAQLQGHEYDAVSAFVLLVLPTFNLAVFYVTWVNLRLGFASVIQAGTDYSISSALSRIGQTAAAAGAGFVAAKVAWSGYFIAVTFLGMAAMAIAWMTHDRLQALVTRRNAQEMESGYPAGERATA